MATTADLLDAAETALLQALQAPASEWGDGGMTAKLYSIRELRDTVAELRRQSAAEGGQMFRLASPIRR